MKSKFFFFAFSIVCFAAICSIGYSFSTGAKNTEHHHCRATEKTAVISALTFYKFSIETNEKNADSVEDQLREFVSVEQINESKFGKVIRSTVDDNNFLRIEYTLSQGGKHCTELIQLATKAIRFAENVTEGKICCRGEKVTVQNED